MQEVKWTAFRCSASWAEPYSDSVPPLYSKIGVIRHLAVQGAPQRRTERNGHRHRDRADKQGQDKHPEDLPATWPELSSLSSLQRKKRTCPSGCLFKSSRAQTHIGQNWVLGKWRLQRPGRALPHCLALAGRAFINVSFCRNQSSVPVTNWILPRQSHRTWD